MATSATVDDIRNNSLPAEVLEFCAKLGLLDSLVVALCHVRSTFAKIEQIEFEVLDEDDFEALIIDVTSRESRMQATESYWACLHQWTQSFEPTVLRRFVLNRRVA